MQHQQKRQISIRAKNAKKQEPICLQVANYRNYNEDPRGTKLPRLFCNNSRWGFKDV